MVAISGGGGKEERAVSEGEIMKKSESEIIPDIDSESDKSDDRRHSTLLPGNKTRATKILGVPALPQLLVYEQRA